MPWKCGVWCLFGILGLLEKIVDTVTDFTVKYVSMVYSRYVGSKFEQKEVLVIIFDDDIYS